MEFYKGRESETHVREVFQRLGDIYFDQTKYADAIAVYKTLLSKWPYYVDAPKVQDRIVRAYEKDRNLVAAAKERERWAATTPRAATGTSTTSDNPDALAVAQQLAEDALLTAATNVHAAAQACKTKWQENQKRHGQARRVQEALRARRPSSTRSTWPPTRTRSAVYEFSAFYADALYYSGQLPQAIAAYKIVRDSILDNRYQEDAAFRMIKALRRDHRRPEARRSRSKTRRSPTRRTPSRRSPPLPMPEIYKKYLDAIDWYVAQHQERPRARPEVRGGGHRAALPRLARRPRSASGRSPRSTAARSRTSASRPTTRSCRPTSSTTTSRTKSRRTARSASSSGRRAVQRVGLRQGAGGEALPGTASRRSSRR